MNTKQLIIPLKNNRQISIKFAKHNDGWNANISDDFLNDIQRLFNNGNYELDSQKQITIG